MAKSPSEQVRELEQVLTAVRERIDHVRGDVNDLRASTRELDQTSADTRLEVALLRQRLDDHLKRIETWGNRRWMLVGLLAGAILSFAANLVVALVRK